MTVYVVEAGQEPEISDKELIMAFEDFEDATFYAERLITNWDNPGADQKATWYKIHDLQKEFDL